MVRAMVALTLCLLVASAHALNSTCLANRIQRVKSGVDPLRGGNLGSWFIQEGWMVSWLWNDNGCPLSANPGTTKLEQCLGKRAQGVMQKHWESFVTEDDFRIMSENNLNTVRLPVGWWQIYDTVGGVSKAKLNQHVEPTNYLPGALKYIDLAFTWGAKYGIGIIIDLHAAPGSQNGYDHSAPPTLGQVLWDKNPANQAQSADSMELYAQRYGSNPALLGFCLLNEPLVNTAILKRYYTALYPRIRKHAPNAIIIINPLVNNQDTVNPEWLNFMNPPRYTNVYMSMHWYHIWGFEGQSDQQKLNYIKNERNAQAAEYNLKNPKPGVIDEWSCGGISDGHTAMQAQLDPISKLKGGWIFWAWSKTNGGDNWSLKVAFEKGWLDKGQTGVQSC